MYPYNSLPPDARQKAWQASTKAQIETLASPAAAENWRAIGPAATNSYYYGNWGLTSGRINSVAISPSNPKIILVGASTGGIWRSTNGGASFIPVTDDQVDLAVGSIAFSKSDPSIVYAGMGDDRLGYLGSGVLKSANSGRTWARVSNGTLPAPGTISKIEVDPSNADRVYVAQYTRLSGDLRVSSGLYLSTDGGINWTKRMSGAPRDIVIDPTNRQRLYLGMSRRDQTSDPLAGLYRSTDAGNTWANIFAFIHDLNKRRDIKIAMSQSSAETIYAYLGGYIGDNLNVRLMVSTDGGSSWASRNTARLDPAQFGYNTYIYAHPASAETVYLGSRDLFKSTDAGISWRNLTRNFSFFSDYYFIYSPEISNTHADQQAFAFSPTDPDEIYIGNDGGLAKTTDGGNSFLSLNSTLSLTQFVGIALHPTDSTISYGGTQDNGTQKRLGSSQLWSEFAPGDGGRVVINPLNPSMVFTTYIRGDIHRFSDNGRSYDRQIASNGTFGEPDTGTRIAFYPPFTGNGVDATLYFGSYRLFISRDLGETWSAPAGDLDLTKGVTEKGSDVLSAIGVSNSNLNVIYTGSAQGRAMVSTNGGMTWTDVTPGLPDRFITSIRVHPDNSSVAYLSVSGFNSGHIFKTTDAGMTWTNISGNLPNIPTNDLLIDSINPSTIYAGTDVGVFRSTSGSGNWQLFNEGMPPVVVTAFAVQSSGLIQAATYGRGAYEINSAHSRPFISSVEFDGNKRVTIRGTSFGASPKVFINGVDQTSRIKSASETAIKLKAKAEKLGLKAGDNSVKVADSSGVTSNTYVLVVRLLDFKLRL